MSALSERAGARYADGAGLVTCGRGRQRIERLGAAGTKLGLDDRCKHWWPFLAQRIASRVGASTSCVPASR